MRRAAGARRRRRAARGHGHRPGVWLAGGALLAVTGAALAGTVPGGVALLYWGMSAATWYCYLLDKRAAQRGTWRVPEARLHLLALAGGWPGALLARELQRHKSQKQPFTTIFWLTVLANSALAGWLLSGGSLPGLPAGIY